MKEFSYHEHNSNSPPLGQYDESMLFNHPHPLGAVTDSDYVFDIDFGGVIQSRTQTTLLQHSLGPSDLPPLYQPQHRASI